MADTYQTDRLWADEPGAGWRRYIITDVFTATPLEGNQLAVFPDGRGLGVDVMQRTARERALAQLPIYVNTFAGRGQAWKTRIFAPYHGVPEDPATGSAAGPLAVHLARHGRIGFGDEIEIRQGEEIGRPSRLYARAEGSADKVERVLVGGSAVIVARGEYRLSKSARLPVNHDETSYYRKVLP